MRSGTTGTIVDVRAVPLRAALIDPFVIASTRLDAVDNVAVAITLADGTRGWGEIATLPPVTRETHDDALRVVDAAAPALLGTSAERWPEVFAAIAAEVPGHEASAAGLEIAIADAWARQRGVPLRALLGPAREPVVTDITLPITTSARAAELAAHWRGLGFTRLKVKVGGDPARDLARIAAIEAAHPEAELALDANEGWTADQALEVVAALRRRGSRLALVEQPVHRDDPEGLARVTREAGVPVAADESCRTPDDARRIAAGGLASALNIKLAKCGLAGALEIVTIARTHGLGLMIGGMVETRIGMGAGAHLASGVGGFSWIDLDTPWLLARDPVRGGTPLRGPEWQVDAVPAGHGGEPAAQEPT